MEQLKVGDQVVMNDRYRVSEANLGRIFTVRSEPQEIGGTVCVFLDDYRGAYAADGLTKLNPVKELTAEERQEFDEAHKVFCECLKMKQPEKNRMFNSGIFNDIAIGYGKIALERMGLTGKSLTLFEMEMQNVFDLYDAEYARKIYIRIDR